MQGCQLEVNEFHILPTNVQTRSPPTAKRCLGIHLKINVIHVPKRFQCRAFAARKYWGEDLGVVHQFRPEDVGEKAAEVAIVGQFPVENEILDAMRQLFPMNELPKGGVAMSVSWASIS